MSQPIPMNDTEMIEQEDDEQTETNSSDVDVEDDEHNEADSSDVTSHAEEPRLPNSAHPVNRSDSSDPSASNSSDFTTDSSSLSATSASSDVIGREQIIIGLLTHMRAVAESALSNSSESQGLPEAQIQNLPTTQISSQHVEVHQRQERPRISVIHVGRLPAAASLTESSNSSVSLGLPEAQIQNLPTTQISRQHVEVHQRQEHPHISVIHVGRLPAAASLTESSNSSPSQGLPEAQIQNLPTTQISRQQVEDHWRQEHPRISVIHIGQLPVAASATESSNSSESQGLPEAQIQNLLTTHISGQQVEDHQRQEHPRIPVLRIRLVATAASSNSSESQGLPDAQIQNLPTTNISGQQVEDGAKCNVCLTDYTERETVCELSCGHLYHSNCIATWLRTNTTCPTCRRNLS